MITITQHGTRLIVTFNVNTRQGHAGDAAAGKTTTAKSRSSSDMVKMIAERFLMNRLGDV
jgi:hypothetical protein